MPWAYTLWHFPLVSGVIPLAVGFDRETSENRGDLNGRSDHVRTAVEGMLRRLRTDRIVPIPDTTTRHRLEENIAGADVELAAVQSASAAAWRSTIHNCER